MLISQINLFIKQLPGMAAWKKTNLTFGGINDFTAKLIGYKNSADCIGITDYDVKTASAEFADQFIEQDKLVLRTKKLHQSIEIMRYSDGNLYSFLSQKNLLRDENQQIFGILFVGAMLSDVMIEKILTVTQHRFFIGNISKKQPNIYTITESQNNSLNLSKRQQESLFFLLRGKTAKEIGEFLNISTRTVQAHIDQLKRKFDCFSRSQLIEKAIAEEYWFNVPKSILKIIRH